MTTSGESVVGHIPNIIPTSMSPAAHTSPKRKRTATLYPKIGKLSDFMFRLGSVAPGTRIIPIAGTVKLHGAHADWVIQSDDTVKVQSRHVLELSSSKDVCGLFAFTSPLHTTIVCLRDDILRRYRQLNPDTPINPAYPVIISGEWCGKGIQTGVAIAQLERHFVVISICVNGAWVDEKEYADIHNESSGIYHISKAGTYRLDYDLDDPESSDEAIRSLVNAIEASCPYGAARGISGTGEGIVWKAVDYVHDPELWFKSKADSHMVSRSSRSPKAGVGPENSAREMDFADAVVTDRRLEQGWEFLREIGVNRELAATGRFVGWITKDVLAEEKQEMVQAKIDTDKLKPWIKSIATAWYKSKVREPPQEDSTELGAIIEKMRSMKA